jgi:ADP-heptose:LPS heptosyltransferase
MRDIGILNLTRFGDLIQTTPVLAGLRKHHPDARIHLIVKSRFRNAAEMLEGVDVIHEIDGDALAEIVSQPGLAFVDGFREVRKVIDGLSKLHFDRLLNFTHSRASAVLLSLLDADEIVGFALDRNGHRRVGSPWLSYLATLVRARKLARFNLVEIYLGAAGLIGKGESLGVRIPRTAREFAAQRLAGNGPLVALQLGASQDTKTWSLEHFAETVRGLRRRMPSSRIVLVGVRAEAETAGALMTACPGVHFEDLVGQTSLDELAAVLQKSDLLLTGDTGTMHLAAAVGTTTCSVFVGLGMPYETAVYAEGHWALMSRIACAPCSHQVKCGHAVCHTDIPSEWLADLLQRILEGSSVADIPPLSRADLLQTHFDEDGLLDLVAVHPRAPEPHDLLAMAYRAVFLESLEGIPVRFETIWQRASERFGVSPQEWSSWLPDTLPERLAELESLGRRAEQLSHQIEGLDTPSDALREAGKALRETDASIYAIARSEPLLAPLGLDLESALEDLPNLDLPILASLSNRHYGILRRRVETLRKLMGMDSTRSLSARRTYVIQLQINGTQQTAAPGSIGELRQLIKDAAPSNEVICVIRVNGIEISEDRLDDFGISSIETVEVQTANPTSLARQALGETQEWIGRICGVLTSIADDYRLGRNREGASRLVTVVDALQVLVGLLQGIHAFLDIDQNERDLLNRSWKEAEVQLRDSIAGLVEDLEIGDPVRLADHTGHILPRSLGRFRDILHEIRA